MVEGWIAAYDGLLPRLAAASLASSTDPDVVVALLRSGWCDDSLLLELLLHESVEVRDSAVSAAQEIESRIIRALTATSAKELFRLASGERNGRVLAALALNPALPATLARQLQSGPGGGLPVVQRAFFRPRSIVLGHLNTYPEHAKQARLRGAASCA